MQRGFVHLLLLLFGLVSLIAFSGAYFYNQQKISSIKNFEECSKHYPVLLSYPGQCNTPDGRHFVQELSDEEKKKLVPPKVEESSSGASLVDMTKWEEYKDKKYGFSFRHPKLMNGQVNIWGPESAKRVNCWDDRKTVIVGTDAPFDGLCIYVDENSKNKSISVYKKELETELNGIREKSQGKEEKIVVDGVSGFDLKGFGIFGADYTLIPWPNSSKFLIIVRINEKEDSFEETYKKILSTFKFSD